MEWSKEAEVLLKLDRKKWTYSGYSMGPQRCLIDDLTQGSHKGKRIVLVSPDGGWYSVVCEEHFPLYERYYWKVYEG